VLVVEDVADAAEALGDALALAGYDVRLAAEAEQALRVAREFGPELILCDIGLPGLLSGYDLARAIRSDPRLRTALLIAVTGYGLPEDRLRAVESGFDAHLAKISSTWSRCSPCCGDRRGTDEKM